MSSLQAKCLSTQVLHLLQDGHQGTIIDFIQESLSLSTELYVANKQVYYTNIKNAIAISIINIANQYGAVVYGGFIRDLLTSSCQNWNDIDLYWFITNKQNASHLLQLFWSLLKRNLSKFLNISMFDINISI